jgi:hypothetical protein
VNIKWKGLDKFVEWCKGHQGDGLTVYEIAAEYLGLDLAKIKSSTVRRYYAGRVAARVSQLKKRVDKSNAVPFISVKKILRGGESVSGYGSLLPDGSEALYVHKTNVIVEGILTNRNKLLDCKKRLTMVQRMAAKKKKVGDVNGS